MNVTPAASASVTFRGRSFPRRAGFVSPNALTCCLGHRHAARLDRDGRFRCYHPLEPQNPRSERCGALLFAIVFPSAGSGTLLWVADVDQHDLTTIERAAMSVAQILAYFGAAFRHARMCAT